MKLAEASEINALVAYMAYQFYKATKNMTTVLPVSCLHSINLERDHTKKGKNTFQFIEYAVQENNIFITRPFGKKTATLTNLTD